MNQDKPAHQDPNAVVSLTGERVASAIYSQQRRIRLFTLFGFVVGFVALIAGVLMVYFYVAKFRPAQQEIMALAKNAEAQIGKLSEGSETESMYRRMVSLQRTQVFMTHLVSMGLAVTAVGVAILAMGILMALTVVVLNRRVTMNQISASLAQISDQLIQLQQRSDRVP